ncbi:hypothetical protein ACFL26_02385 [Patescibacteria group bacterium]
MEETTLDPARVQNLHFHNMCSRVLHIVVGVRGQRLLIEVCAQPIKGSFQLEPYDLATVPVDDRIRRCISPASVSCQIWNKTGGNLGLGALTVADDGTSVTFTFAEIVN